MPKGGKKPRDLRILEGNPQRRKVPDLDPGKRIDLKRTIDREPPKDLKKTGQELWPIIVDTALWLAPCDALMLRELCLVADEIKEIKDALKRWDQSYKHDKLTAKGRLMKVEKTSPSPDGGVFTDFEYKKNPLTAQLLACQKRYDQIATNLGLNPLARTRVSIADVTRKQDFDNSSKYE